MSDFLSLWLINQKAFCYYSFLNFCSFQVPVWDIFLSVIELCAVDIIKKKKKKKPILMQTNFHQWLLANFKWYNDNILGIILLIFPFSYLFLFFICVYIELIFKFFFLRKPWCIQFLYRPILLLALQSGLLILQWNRDLCPWSPEKQFSTLT